MRKALLILLLVAIIAPLSTVLAQPYSATITTDKDVVTVGETITITVVISPPAAGVTITIKIIDPVGAERTLPPETTDTNGKAVFHWTPEPGIREGVYTLEVYISGQAGVAATKTIKIVVPPPVGGSDLLIDKLELAISYIRMCIMNILSELIIVIAILLFATIALSIIIKKRR